MTINLDKSLDATAAVVRIIGNTAEIAMRVGNVALPILQDVGLLVAPVAIAANYVATALPYITKVAQYAPAVSAGIEQNKPMIEAAISVGQAVVEPLAKLLEEIPQLAQAHVLFADLDKIIKNSEFSPQDPRFYRAGNPADF